MNNLKEDKHFASVYFLCVIIYINVPIMGSMFNYNDGIVIK